MYRHSLITFVDILGFRSLISSSDFNGVSKKLKAVTRVSGASEQSNEDELAPKVIQFSDSIIRIRPLDHTRPYGALFHELLDLIHMQGELVQHGVCMRGGIAVGDVHFEAHTAYGPGFVRAYEIESTFANFPRIVVDPAVLARLNDDERLGADHNRLEDDIDSVKKLLRRDSDGLYFVDYLSVFLGELDHVSFEPMFIIAHKNLILGGLRDVENLTSVSAKYLWLANYHNNFVRRLSKKWLRDSHLQLADVEIKSSEMPLNFEWPA
jgi:hypothetical protein